MTCNKTIFVNQAIAAYNAKVVECGCADPSSLFPSDITTMCGDSDKEGGLLRQIRAATLNLIETCGLQTAQISDPGLPDCPDGSYVNDLVQWITSLGCGDSDCLVPLTQGVFSLNTDGIVNESISYFDFGNLFTAGRYRVVYRDGALWLNDEPTGRRGRDGVFAHREYGHFYWTGGLVKFGIMLVVDACRVIGSDNLSTGDFEEWREQQLLIHPLRGEAAWFQTEALAITFLSGVEDAVEFTTAYPSRIGLCIGMRREPGGFTLSETYTARSDALFIDTPITYNIAPCANRCTPQPITNPRFTRNDPGVPGTISWTPPSNRCVTGYRIYMDQISCDDCHNLPDQPETLISGFDPLDFCNLINAVLPKNGTEDIATFTVDQSRLPVDGTYCARIDTINNEIDENGVITEVVAEGPKWCFEYVCEDEVPIVDIITPNAEGEVFGVSFASFVADNSFAPIRIEYSWATKIVITSEREVRIFDGLTYQEAPQILVVNPGMSVPQGQSNISFLVENLCKTFTDTRTILITWTPSDPPPPGTGGIGGTSNEFHEIDIPQNLQVGDFFNIAAPQTAHIVASWALSNGFGGIVARGGVIDGQIQNFPTGFRVPGAGAGNAFGGRLNLEIGLIP